MSAATTELSHRHATEIAFGGLFMRLFLGFMGIALCVSAFGLWLVPGAAHMPELSLMKLGLSVFMLIAGLCLLLLARAHREG